MAIKYRILKRKMLIRSVTQAAWKKINSSTTWLVVLKASSFIGRYIILNTITFLSLRRIFYAFLGSSGGSNVNFWISLRWLIYFIDWVDKTKTPVRSGTQEHF